MRHIAALFVEADGPYSEILHCDVWDVSRDARRYGGPHPVVAHPPCERWGRYWSGGPSAKVKRRLGDDGGCFESALESVRRFGGVLEHPEASHAFRVFGLGRPPRAGGWVRSADGIGWVCCVEQGHYEHPARKATWLYAVNAPLLDLWWGPAVGCRRLEDGFYSREERAAAKLRGWKPVERLSHRERLLTPRPFCDVLVAMARGVDAAGQ